MFNPTILNILYDFMPTETESTAKGLVNCKKSGVNDHYTGYGIRTDN